MIEFASMKLSSDDSKGLSFYTAEVEGIIWRRKIIVELFKKPKYFVKRRIFDPYMILKL